MTLHAEFDRLHTFLQGLTRFNIEEQKEAFINECIENGGSYIPPENTAWGKPMSKIHLHGVGGLGDTEEDAIHNWINAAKAHIARNKASPATNSPMTAHHTTGKGGLT